MATRMNHDRGPRFERGQRRPTQDLPLVVAERPEATDLADEPGPYPGVVDAHREFPDHLGRHVLLRPATHVRRVGFRNVEAGSGHDPDPAPPGDAHQGARVAGDVAGSGIDEGVTSGPVVPGGLLPSGHLVVELQVVHIGGPVLADPLDVLLRNRLVGPVTLRRLDRLHEGGVQEEQVLVGHGHPELLRSDRPGDGLDDAAHTREGSVQALTTTPRPGSSVGRRPLRSARGRRG